MGMIIGLGVRQGAQVKCIYTNACSIGNKQEDLEDIVLWQAVYDLVAITETWWDCSNDWSAAVGGYKLFRRDRVESLWVRMKAKANKTDILVGVCFRPPNQDEEADKTFYRQ